MTDLYVLNWAAMQAVSALEARLRSDDDAVLIAEPRVQEFGVVDRVSWGEKHWVDIRTREAGLARVIHWRRFAKKIAEIVEKAGPIRRCYVGQLGVPMSHIAQACGAAEVVVLDAGLVTLKVARQRHQRLGLRQRFVSLVRATIGIRGEQPKSVTFFTAYGLDVREPDRLRRHAYEQLRAAAAGGADVDETWFVGQNFVEGGSATRPQSQRGLARQRVGALLRMSRIPARPTSGWPSWRSASVSLSDGLAIPSKLSCSRNGRGRLSACVLRRSIRRL